MKTRLIAAVFLCLLFIFYGGTVQSCTILIINHGTHLRESTKYWEQVGYTLTTCEATCGSDALCFGYFFDSDDGTCMKSAETLYKNANNCPTCSFHSKRCGLDCSLTYTSYVNDKTSENPYLVSAKSYLECEASCSSDQNCTGFGYDSSNSQCSLTEYNVVEATDIPCATCSFSKKVCNGSLGGETTTPNAITEPTTLTSVVTTLNDLRTTPDVIQTTETTTASNTDIETSTSILSSMDDTTTNDQITTFASPESTITTIIPRPTTTTNQDITSDIITTKSETTFTYKDTTSDITTMTTESPPWDKYITSDVITTTSESTAQATSSELLTTKSTSTALAYTNAGETTTNTDSISSMSIYFTENNDVNGSSNLCVCQCVYDNITSLEVRIEERKNTLKMIKEDLSSFHRRLNCAYDPRKSSKVVGGVGILVLTLIMSLIIIPDILTTASRLTRKKKKTV